MDVMTWTQPPGQFGVRDDEDGDLESWMACPSVVKKEIAREMVTRKKRKEEGQKSCKIILWSLWDEDDILFGRKGFRFCLKFFFLFTE